MFRTDRPRSPDQRAGRSSTLAAARVRFAAGPIAAPPIAPPRAEPPIAPPRAEPGASARPLSPASSTPDAVDVRATVADIRQPGTSPRRPGWLRPYQVALLIVDICAALIGSIGSYLARFMVVTPNLSENLPYLELCLTVPFAWVGLLGWNRAYERRFLAVGPDEFQRVLRAFLLLIASVSFVSYVTKVEIARGFVVMALPATVALTLTGRLILRAMLHRRRALGSAMSSVVLVGAVRSVLDMARTLGDDLGAGMLVVGACIPQESLNDAALRQLLSDANIDVLGNLDAVCEVVNRFNIETVAVTSSTEIGLENLRWISWQLEETSADLVVAPGLIEVAGSRLHVRPVAGLPLLHVEKPEFVGFRRVVKAVMDRTTAALALLLLAPLLALLAVVIRVSSRGPVLFRQTRVGMDGSTFTMFKFRSMVSDAEQWQTELAAHNDHCGGVLFKMQHDPRITGVGRVLRKFSLDELPQLFNVLSGSMSLVGPRPPLPSEVENYAGHAHRRLLVKPGLTGLWQVSGRSNLNWDEAVRLDLRYVENWSPALDVAILARTVAAVLRGRGAY